MSSELLALINFGRVKFICEFACQFWNELKHRFDNNIDCSLLRYSILTAILAFGCDCLKKIKTSLFSDYGCAIIMLY